MSPARLPISVNNDERKYASNIVEAIISSEAKSVAPGKYMEWSNLYRSIYKSARNDEILARFVMQGMVRPRPTSLDSRCTSLAIQEAESWNNYNVRIHGQRASLDMLRECVCRFLTEASRSAAAGKAAKLMAMADEVPAIRDKVFDNLNAAYWQRGGAHALNASADYLLQRDDLASAEDFVKALTADIRPLGFGRTRA